MKIISKTLKILPLLFAVVAFQGCSDDDDNQIFNPQPQTPNIVELAQDTPALASLVAAIGSASGDLGNVLSGNGPFTVLAPTNDAFQALLDSNPAWNTVDDIDDAVLEQVLRNHVIPADIMAADLVSLSGADGRGYARTLAAGTSGENVSILFDTNDALPRFNNASSVVSAELADVDASNGTVHVVDAVILIPTIVDHVVNNPSLQSLEDALVGEGLVPLPGTAPHTVFAPTNDTFGNFMNPNGNGLTPILANHVVENAAAFSGGLATGYVNTLATNADGDALSMFVNTADGVLLNNVANVTTADVVGTDGVIHIVDAVIDLPTIVTHAVANPGFSTLVTALTTLTPDTDYVSVLSANDAGNDASPFTVFAPDNAAFDALLGDLGLTSFDEIPTATLEATLNLHVLTDLNVRAEDLGGLDGQSVPTFGGPSITIDAMTPAIIDPDGGSNPIDAVNVQAINGVIHSLNRVIRDL